MNDFDIISLDKHFSKDISTPTLQDRHLLIDKENWMRIMQLSNFGAVYAYDSGHGIVARVNLGGGKVTEVHRLVRPEYRWVGFRNGMKLDCRKENLFDKSLGHIHKGGACFRNYEMGNPDCFVCPINDTCRATTAKLMAKTA